MKKCVLIASIALFLVSLSATLCFSQLDRTVGNTSKKGSLVIWPLVKVGAGDTTILLGNDYYRTVKVKCTYRVPFPFSDTSWSFNLMPNQTISWLASTGKGPDGKTIPRVGVNFPALASGVTAELRCWAVNTAGTQQIVWNWLSGEAIVTEGKDQSWGYSAWRFAVNSSTTGANAGTAGQIRLSGDTGNYDTCPTGLIFNLLKQTPNPTGSSFAKGTVNNVVTLVPCAVDYVANTTPSVFTNLPTYDEDQGSSSAASLCVGTTASATQWFSESLVSSKLILAAGTVNPFPNLATPGGTIYIHGKQDSRCGGSTGVPLIGVMSMQFVSKTGPYAGVPPTSVGPGQGYVRDASDTSYTSTPIMMKWQ